MNDTDPKVSALIEARFQAMTPLERLEIASSMFDTARAIVDCSLMGRTIRPSMVSSGHLQVEGPDQATVFRFEIYAGHASR